MLSAMHRRLPASGMLCLAMSVFSGCWTAHGGIARSAIPEPPVVSRPVIDELLGGQCPLAADFVFGPGERHRVQIRAMRNGRE